MSRENQLKLCAVCVNKSFNPSSGIVCGITNEPPAFENHCSDYVENEQAVKMQTLQKQQTKNDNNKTINQGRYALFIVGALYILIGIYEGFLADGHDIIYAIIDWVAALVFVGFGLLSYKKASLSLLLGLIFYILIVVLIGLVDVSTIFKGIIWKILIISALVKSYMMAKEQEKLTKQVNPDILDQV